MNPVKLCRIDLYIVCIVSISFLGGVRILASTRFSREIVIYTDVGVTGLTSVHY